MAPEKWCIIDPMSSPVIAIANQKGAFGKTTTTVNVAHALIKEGKRVLVIDLDPQASLSIALGYSATTIKHLEEERRTIYFALVKGRPLLGMICDVNLVDTRE